MDTPLATLIAHNFAEFEEDYCHGFFDWFCLDSKLSNKSKRLASKVRAITKITKKYDPTKVYVFFKNNCCGNGKLYDDFRICDIETGKVKYTVVPKDGYTEHSEVWGEDNDFHGPLVEGTWKDVKQFFAA